MAGRLQRFAAALRLASHRDCDALAPDLPNRTLLDHSIIAAGAHPDALDRVRHLDDAHGTVRMSRHCPARGAASHRLPLKLQAKFTLEASLRSISGGRQGVEQDRGIIAASRCRVGMVSGSASGRGRTLRRLPRERVRIVPPQRFAALLLCVPLSTSALCEQLAMARAARQSKNVVDCRTAIKCPWLVSGLDQRRAVHSVLAIRPNEASAGESLPGMRRGDGTAGP